MLNELEEHRDLLKDTERERGLDEQELLDTLEAFIRPMMSDGLSRERALEIARDVLRKANDTHARRRRGLRWLGRAVSGRQFVTEVRMSGFERATRFRY